MAGFSNDDSPLPLHDIRREEKEGEVYPGLAHGNAC